MRFISWLTGPSNVTSLERLAELRGGETEQEVEDILGAPGVDNTTIRKFLLGHSDVAEVKFLPIHSKGSLVSSRWKEWRTRGGKHIAVCFNDAYKVVAAATFKVSDTWFEKIRRWLRLSR
jgi:hypothetical protein